MNILSRINKLENKLNLNSAFCACQKEILFKVVPFSESENRNLEKKICEICHKPEADPFNFTFSFNNEIELILPKLPQSENER